MNASQSLTLTLMVVIAIIALAAYTKNVGFWKALKQSQPWPAIQSPTINVPGFKVGG